MIWLGKMRGYLTDWVTQKWVQATGRRVNGQPDWLQGPVGRPEGIGPNYFEALARQEGYTLASDGVRGLLPSFSALAAADFCPEDVAPEVRAFYERTSEYQLDAWSEWCGGFRPFGRLLALLFSRRLQQLNVPLSSLDTSRGISSEVLQAIEPLSGRVLFTAWVRRLLGSGNVLYAGAYTLCQIPNRPGMCVEIVFPLPNGNALVLMRPRVDPDGSFTIASAGMVFGDPGFYFTVHDGAGKVWARYVRSLRETIRVYPAAGEVRADHELTYFGARFLRLHYRLRPAA